MKCLLIHNDKEKKLNTLNNHDHPTNFKSLFFKCNTVLLAACYQTYTSRIVEMSWNIMIYFCPMTLPCFCCLFIVCCFFFCMRHTALLHLFLTFTISTHLSCATSLTLLFPFLSLRKQPYSTPHFSPENKSDKAPALTETDVQHASLWLDIENTVRESERTHAHTHPQIHARRWGRRYSPQDLQAHSLLTSPVLVKTVCVEQTHSMQVTLRTRRAQHSFKAWACVCVEL